LNGANEVPPVATAAIGNASFVLDSSPRASFVHTVVSATRITLNSGVAGANGPVLLDFFPGLSPLGNNIQVSLGLLAQFPIVNLFATNTIPTGYVNIASAAFPQGEIRGQLAYNPINVFSDTFSGQKEVPPVTSSLTGNAMLTYDSLLNALYFNISSTSTTTTSVVLKGPASPTSTGADLAILCSFKCNARRIFFGVLNQGSSAFVNGQTLASVLAILQQGQAYVELKTTQNPNGEIRANLLASVSNTQNAQLPNSAFVRPPIDLNESPLPSVAPSLIGSVSFPSVSPSLPGVSVPFFFRKRNK
jgi:hypothetical protein